MERKLYLDLCRKNAQNRYAPKVLLNGVKYRPKEYILWFDERGNSKHTAVLRGMYSNSEIRCNLSDVEECEDERLG